jgi:hypothetical protein
MSGYKERRALTVLPLQVLCDRLELVDRAALIGRNGTDGLFQAVIEVILDQRFLGLADCLLNGMQLLGNIDTGSARLDHLDDALQVTVCPLQAHCDVFMMGVFLIVAHAEAISPLGDIVKSVTLLMQPRKGPTPVQSDTQAEVWQSLIDGPF